MNAPTMHHPQPPSGLSLPPFARDWALFLDVDGTLLDVADRPDAVRCEPDLPSVLVRLQTFLSGALALISGRSIAFLDDVLGLPGLCMAGQHGAERRDARGQSVLHSPRSPALAEILPGLMQLVERHPGLLIEDKGLGLALHFRLAPQHEMLAFDAMRSALGVLGPGFELQAGKMVFELKSRGRDKAAAIAAFLGEPPFLGRRAVFVGDDETDETGFAEVNRRQGYSVKVGPGPSVARYRLGDACAVRGWLRGIANAQTGDAGEHSP